MDNAFSGKYTTKRDGGIEYTYEANWRQTGAQVRWYAKVRRGADHAGSPSGNILNVEGLGNIEAQVRANLEMAIEVRASIHA